MASQITPPADSRSAAASGPSAKPNSSSMSTARNRTALKFAIVRRSVRRSFHATARARASSRRMERAPERAADYAAVIQLDHPAERRIGALEIVQHDDGAAAAIADARQQIVDERNAVFVETVVRLVENGVA